MSRIRAVIFDFGGVIYRQPNPQHMARWLHLFGIRDLGLLSVMNTSPLDSQLVMDIMTGKLAEQQVWVDLAKSWRVRPGILHFIRRRGFSARRVNHDLLAFLSHLRPHLRTAILTNAGTDFRDTFCSIYRLPDLVDQVIISAEEQIAKPDKRLYHLAAERLGVSPEEAIFVDDMPVNVEGALEAGMQAFLHTNVQFTIQQIRGMLAEAE